MQLFLTYSTRTKLPKSNFSFKKSNIHPPLLEHKSSILHHINSQNPYITETSKIQHNGTLNIKCKKSLSSFSSCSKTPKIILHFKIYFSCKACWELEIPCPGSVNANNYSHGPSTIKVSKLPFHTFQWIACNYKWCDKNFMNWKCCTSSSNKVN